jgi:hypothetical protein
MICASSVEGYRKAQHELKRLKEFRSSRADVGLLTTAFSRLKQRNRPITVKIFSPSEEAKEPIYALQAITEKNTRMPESTYTQTEKVFDALASSKLEVHGFEDRCQGFDFASMVGNHRWLLLRESRC